MDREILFKAKHEHVVVANKDLEGQWVEGLLWDEEYIYSRDIECEPFCYSMPLTDTYIKLNEMEVIGNIFDNPELLEERDRKDERMEETERI